MSGSVTVSGDQKRVVDLCSLVARELLCVKYEKRGGIVYNRDCKVNGNVLKHVLTRTNKGETKDMTITEGCLLFSDKRKENSNEKQK